MEIVPQLFANSIIASAIYMMIALGFNLIFSTVKFFELGYGALTAVGGYTAFYFSQKIGIHIIPSILLGVLFAGILGFLINKLIYEKLSKKKASTMVLLVASLGVLTAIPAFIAILFTSQFQSFTRVLGEVKVYEILGGVITQIQVIILVLGFVVMVGLAVLLKMTRLGKAIRAIGDDKEVSAIVGINTSKIIGYVFFISSAIAGLAGILFGLDTGIEPTMGLPLILKGIVASIIGGIGNVYGGVIGAFILGFAENFGIWLIPGEWKEAITFVILILFLLFRPQGLLKR